MREYHLEVFGRKPSLVYTADLPLVGEKWWKTPAWNSEVAEASGHGCWGIHLEDEEDEDG